tara:strand:- start:893 stop:1519 length:627 start_codon:yes stop_codon:yes gene_type:complete
MSFRLEEKIKLHISDLNKLRSHLQFINVKELYPKRKISSIYFDNKFFEMYRDSEEGCVPRKKVRIRHYPEEKNPSKNLETKITSVEGKYKVNKKISSDLNNYYFKNGIFVQQYGNCDPVIKVSYTREYLILKNCRFTIDYDIKYEGVTFNKIFNDNETLVLELKSSSDIISNLNLFSDFIPMQRVRYTKYCEGINLLYNKPHQQRIYI